MSILKILSGLLSAVALSACAASPGKPVENTYGQSTLDPSITVERVTLADNQGVSTMKIVRQGGVTIKADWVDESSTSEQDVLITAVGTIGPAVVNGVTAGIISHNNRKSYKDNGSAGGQQVTSVNVNTSSNATSSANSGGAAGPCGRPVCPHLGTVD